MQLKDFATTFQSGFADESFSQRATPITVPEILDRLPRARFSPLAELTLFLNVIRAARRHRTLLLFSSRGYTKPELWAAASLGLLPRPMRPTVVFYGEMYEPSGGLRGSLERLVMRLARPGISRYVLFSDAEHKTFSELWNVPLGSLDTCHCFLPADPSEKPAADLPNLERPYVFGGGSSFRDFRPVMEAARILPHTRFVIAADPVALPGELPSNVTLASLERNHYRPLLENASVVVVPLRLDLRRAAGMYTYLRAMQLGKTVIVSDAIAVREYVENGSSGIVVEPSGQAYANAINYALDPANADAIRRMSARASAAVEDRFTIRPYAERMLRIIDEARRWNTEDAPVAEVKLG